MIKQTGLCSDAKALLHQHCFACGQAHPFGLHLNFRPEESNSLGCVVGTVNIPGSYQGYNGVVHGGIVSTILDSAMTTLLLEKGICAFTVELNLRFRRMVLPELKTDVRAELLDARAPLYRLEGRLIQKGQVAAVAKARFMTPTEMPDDLRREMESVL